MTGIFDNLMTSFQSVRPGILSNSGFSSGGILSTLNLQGILTDRQNILSARMNAIKSAPTLQDKITSIKSVPFISSTGPLGKLTGGLTARSSLMPPPPLPPPPPAKQYSPMGPGVYTPNVPASQSKAKFF